MQVSKLSRIAQSFFNMIEFDENEELICEIRKHPFGLFIVYFTGFVVTFALTIVLVLLLVNLRGDPLQTGSNLSVWRPLVAIVGLLLIGLSLVVTAIGGYLYKSNVVIVTSEKIAQLVYINLFNRKISQLSIGDVQDVTVQQRGIFPRLFNYGTLVIETAGEQQNYNFTFTPDPYTFSKEIVGAHERNLVKYGN